jgi:hypothetical protein
MDRYLRTGACRHTLQSLRMRASQEKIRRAAFPG